MYAFFHENELDITMITWRYRPEEERPVSLTQTGCVKLAIMYNTLRDARFLLFLGNTFRTGDDSLDRPFSVQIWSTDQDRVAYIIVQYIRPSIHHLHTMYVCTNNVLQS